MTRKEMASQNQIRTGEDDLVHSEHLQMLRKTGLNKLGHYEEDNGGSGRGIDEESWSACSNWTLLRWSSLNQRSLEWENLQHEREKQEGRRCWSRAYASAA